MEKDEHKKLVICLHCGNKNPVKILHSYTMLDAIEVYEGQELGFEVYFTFAKCSVCNEPLLFVTTEADDDPSDLRGASILFPNSKKFPKSVPMQIAKNYFEAKRIEKISATGFVVLIRRALEFLCKDKNAAGRNLKDQIKDLADRDIIPQTLSQMATALRFVGNIGAHANEIEISSNEVRLIDEFFVAVVEYVYVAPTKLKLLDEQIKKLQGTAAIVKSK